MVQLGRDVTDLDQESLLSLLREYMNVFGFRPEEMPGIAPTVMKHWLNVDPLHGPII